ncbi:hypothetical protein [Sorangium sp. So ce1099]|uniref:hypothetical protein n=1 Tax=Sorangium sp. So ce1099 TaxID=3133331 RepID=UPI003F62951E
MATAKKTTTKTAGAVKVKATTGAKAAGSAGSAKATKGTATKGAATKGAATKGAATKGAATKGTATKGTATKGAATKGTATKGAATKAAAIKDTSTKGAGSDGNTSTFEALRSILQRHARHLVVVHDTPDNYYLDTRTKGPNGKPLFFGATRAGRAYTSFYLMPVYTNPELLGGVSPELKKRMQGKSCFNFKTNEPALFAELEALTGRCFERWKASGQV